MANFKQGPKSFFSRGLVFECAGHFECAGQVLY